MQSRQLVSSPGEDEGAFHGRLADLVHADRDLEIEKLRKKYAPKLARLQERIARAQDKVEREEEQYADRKTQTVVSLGATLLGAVFGRKLGSAGNIGRAASTMRRAGRAARERADIGRAEDRVRRSSSSSPSSRRSSRPTSIASRTGRPTSSPSSTRCASRRARATSRSNGCISSGSRRGSTRTIAWARGQPGRA
ncbi:MAG: hypothetical protein R3E53_19590 [Myxococcota bacterium]